jgi:hypothetical protein
MNQNWLDIKFQIYSVYLYQLFRQYFSNQIYNVYLYQLFRQYFSNYIVYLKFESEFRRRLKFELWIPNFNCPLLQKGPLYRHLTSVVVLNFIRRLSITERNKFESLAFRFPQGMESVRHCSSSVHMEVT